MQKNKILFIEPAASGHHLVLYTKLIFQAAIEKVEIHLMTTEETVNNTSFKQLKDEFKNNFYLHLMPPVNTNNKNNSALNLLKIQFSYYHSISLGFNNIKDNNIFKHVFLVNFDHCDKIFSILGSPFKKISYSGILMNIKFHRSINGIGPKSRSDLLYKCLFKKLLSGKYLEKLFVVDPLFHKYYVEVNKQKIVYLPEPSLDLIGSCSKNESRSKLGLNEKQFIILVFGSLTIRKGIVELINAISHLNDSRFTVILAGAMDVHILSLLEETPAQKLINNNSLKLFKGFQDEENQFHLFNASDLVWVAYGEGFTASSGVYYQAAYFSKPVITANNGLLKYLVDTNKNGTKCDINDREDISNNLLKLINDKKFYIDCCEKSTILSFFHKNNNFGKIIVNHIND